MARPGSCLAQGGRPAGSLHRGVNKKRLIAGDLQRVIRALLSGEGIASCSREDSFEEIYEALGDVQTQETIRKASPDKAHCKLLTDSKFGASFCPQCPNNPRLETDLKTGQKNPRAEIYRLVNDFGGLAEEVLGLAMHVRYGFVPILESYVERELAVMTCFELEAATERRQQDHLAQRLAEMLSAMFGGKN